MVLICCFSIILILNHFCQGEAIHPLCTFVAQHMEAQEQCMYTRQQETHNNTTITGKLPLVSTIFEISLPIPESTVYYTHAWALNWTQRIMPMTHICYWSRVYCRSKNALEKKVEEMWLPQKCNSFCTHIAHWHGNSAGLGNQQTLWPAAWSTRKLFAAVWSSRSSSKYV